MGNGAPVAVLSHDFSQREFNGDENVRAD